jgi:hypothetical protein
MDKPVRLFLETLFTDAAVAYKKTAVRKNNPSSARVPYAPSFRHLSESMVPKVDAMLLLYISTFHISTSSNLSYCQFIYHNFCIELNPYLKTVV